MKITLKTKLATAWITSSWVGVVLLSIQPTMAQIAPSGSLTNPSGSFQGLPQDERDTFPNSSSLFELLNRIQSLNSGTPEAVDLDAAAAEFRNRQRQRLQGQQQPLPPTPAQQVNPASVQ